MKLRNEALVMILFAAVLSAAILKLDPGRSYLVWNIGLALVPYFSSLILSKNDTVYYSKVLFPFFILVWLLFYPNAMYMVTDFIHFSLQTFYKASAQGTSLFGMKVEYVLDLSLWISFALTVCAVFYGVASGYMSITRVEKAIFKEKPASGRVVFIMAVSLLTGFAIYIGRFLRFNSWDIIKDPLAILSFVKDGMTMDAIYMILAFAAMHLFITAVLRLSTAAAEG
ncbi:DUF1361 domain-containing protein [Youngiibacter fragilis]|uniref:DUF1361 domain-containing protein n=1 Tax=Youngiibacter fragilis 232.1 TaxID=994573 RepID=V7I785_9CLOT|nr:DUF1361 domain-containing protein [Youngiibacter fragilis]ETA81121.1 hypothetical protein T472_0208155 [Youngiibacter fragilis 232.1]